MLTLSARSWRPPGWARWPSNATRSPLRRAAPKRRSRKSWDRWTRSRRSPCPSKTRSSGSRRPRSRTTADPPESGPAAAPAAGSSIADVPADNLPVDLPSADLGPWRRFPALASPAYRRFIFGALLSNIGSWMQATAQGWLVLGLTNSAALLGLTSAAANLPILLFSLYAGVLADRVDQRRLLVFTQSAAAVFTAILALLTTLGVVEFWHVLVIAFLVGCTSALTSPAYQALVSAMVDARSLGSAIALNSAQFNLSRIVGPS